MSHSTHTLVWRQKTDQQGRRDDRLDVPDVCPLVERRGYPAQTRSRSVPSHSRGVWQLADIDVEQEVAYLASNYLRWLSWGIPGYGGTVLIKKYDAAPF